MLAVANDYAEEVCAKFHQVWYNPKYQYYFGFDDRWVPDFHSDYGNGIVRHFVSVNSKDEVLGYMTYRFDPNIRLATGFGAINFSEDKATFGRDLAKMIDDIFQKFGANTLEFSVIKGNPIEESYDRMVEKFGGRILCIRHLRAMKMNGELCDDKMYEITRQEYLNALKVRAEKRRGAV